MNTRDMVLVALFAAIVAVLGLVPKVDLPLGVPITAQTLGVMLAGSLLGARRGALALLVFAVLVLAGLPLLAGGRGGLAVLAGPTAGFFLAWPLAAGVTGWLVERFWARLGWVRAFAANVLGGIAVIYLVGVPWLAVQADLTLMQALAGSGAFVPGDLIKAAIAAAASVTVHHNYPLIQSTRSA